MSGSIEPVLAPIAELRETLRGELTRVDVITRFDRRRNLLTLMKDDTQVNIAAADTTREQLELFRNEHEDLVRRVCLVHRPLLRLEQRFDARENGA